jgi:hypothetical protein
MISGATVTETSGRYYSGYFTGGPAYFGGNVGIGNTAPPKPLTVQGDISGSGTLYIQPNTNASAEIGEAHVGYIGHSTYAGFSHADCNSTTGYALLQSSAGFTMLNAASGQHIQFRVNNSMKVEISDQGGFGVGTAPSTTAGHIRATDDIVAFYSDERLKEKITIGIENPIDKIKNINTFTYKHNELANTLGFKGDKIYIGVGAKAVKESLPEAVEVAPFDANEDGSSKSGEDYLTVQYERLVPLLIEAIKEQQEQIVELKQQIEEIKDGMSK